MHCALADMVGVSYRDPDGGRVYAYAADHAVIEVEVRRRTVRGWSRRGAAVGRQLRLRVRQPDAGAGRRGGAVSAGLALAPGPLPLLDWAAAPAGVRVSFTCRHGGVSSGPFASLNLGALTADDAANVAENRRRAVAGAGGDGATRDHGLAGARHGHPRGDRQAVARDASCSPARSRSPSRTAWSPAAAAGR